MHFDFWCYTFFVADIKGYIRQFAVIRMSMLKTMGYEETGFGDRYEAYWLVSSVEVANLFWVCQYL